MNYCMCILASLSRLFTWSWTVVAQLVSRIRHFSDPMDCSPPGSSVHGLSQARILEGVGCHFLLQGIFLTQGLNPGLLHCRWILFTTEPPGKGCLYQLLYVSLGIHELVIYLVNSTISVFSSCIFLNMYFRRRNLNDQKTYGKLFNFTSNQRNAN